MVTLKIRLFLTGVLAACLGCLPSARADDESTPEIDCNWTWVETPFGRPVIDRGPSGDWDHVAVDNPYVYVEDGRYYCFFEAQDIKGAGWHERVGLAISRDGVKWSKCPDNPMLDVGPAEAWDGVVAKLPAGVTKRDGTYYLFYSGRDKGDVKQTTKSLGVATAKNLTGPWRKHPGNPILGGRDDCWDRHVTTLPAGVFQRDGRYRLLYRGMKGFYHDQGLGAAISSDLLNWERVAEVTTRPLIPAKHEIASIAVATAGGKYVGISQPMKLADRRYWHSNDLFTWKKGPPVKFKASSKAETISNPFLVDGRWNVLYEQGDRIYRAVLTPPSSGDNKTTAKGDDSPGPLRELWRVRLTVNSPCNVIVGRLKGGACLCVGGSDAKQGQGGTIEALNAEGRPLWRSSAGAGRGIGAYLQWIDLGADAESLVASSFVTKDAKAPGGARFIRARDGGLVKEIENVTHFGNNNSIVADLDGDKRPEFVYADQSTLTCYDLPDFQMRWRFAEGVRFCWSLPALADTNGDGRAEIVFGSEYNAGDSNSSMLAVDAKGKQVWRSDGHAEDLGSTPVFVADVDGDDKNELLKVGLDLEHRQKQEWNHLYVFGLGGKLKSKVELGFTGIAIGDMDGDGHLEGVGLTNTRDGGHNRHREVRCIDLATGRVKWTTPVERAYLDNNSPVMADINGDGKLEAVVGTGNPAGYGRLPNSQPWGDLYVLDGRGEILQRIELPGYPVNHAICDVNDDGLNELSVVINGIPGWLALYQTKAPASRNDWPSPFGSPRRDGTMHLPERRSP